MREIEYADTAESELRDSPQGDPPRAEHVASGSGSCGGAAEGPDFALLQWRVPEAPKARRDREGAGHGCEGARGIICHFPDRCEHQHLPSGADGSSGADAVVRGRGDERGCGVPHRGDGLGGAGKADGADIDEWLSLVTPFVLQVIDREELAAFGRRIPETAMHLFAGLAIVLTRAGHVEEELQELVRQAGFFGSNA
jgi:hypothetical protein